MTTGIGIAKDIFVTLYQADGSTRQVRSSLLLLCVALTV